MSEIVFSDQPTGSQRGIFTFDELDPEEFRLVEAVVNWNNPGRFRDLVYLVHGRSITFVSPDRLNLPSMDAFQGRYHGLQLFGAGGSLQALREGIQTVPAQIVVSSVNPTNHAEQLSKILQQRTINKHGQLKFWQRPYSPLHGMDKKEADKREGFTGQLSEFLEYINRERSISPFIIPEYAAGGYFPAKVDLDGTPLQFQVYRVPLVPRLPSQVFRTIKSHGYDDTLEWFAEGAIEVGSTFRILHRENLAYMGGYLGNMSYLNDDEGKRVLFITDLGSMEDITNHPYKLRYWGFDIYMFLESTRIFIRDLASWVYKNKLSEKSFDDIEEDLILTVGYNMLGGYLRLNKQLGTGEEFNRRIYTQGKEVLGGFAQNVDNPQRFIEFFEQYFTEHVTASTSYPFIGSSVKQPGTNKDSS